MKKLILYLTVFIILATSCVSQKEYHKIIPKIETTKKPKEGKAVKAIAYACSFCTIGVGVVVLIWGGKKNN